MKITSTIFTLLALLFVNITHGQINIAPLATVTHTGGGQTTAGYGPELINDGVITYVNSPGPGFISWVNSNGAYEFIWPNAVTFDSLIFHTSERAYTSITLQYWDGTAYVTFATITNGIMLSPNRLKLNANITTTRFRMFNCAGSNPNFSEVEIFLGVKDDITPKRMVTPVLNANLCSGYHEVNICFENKGSNDIDSFEYYYEYQNVLNGPFKYSRTIGTSDSAIIKLGYLDIPYGSVAPLRLYTRMPNGVVDGNVANDTLKLNLSAGIQGISIPAFPDTSMCEDDLLILNAGYNINCDYTWSNGQQTQEVVINTPGTYWLHAYNTQGCSYRDTFEVVAKPNVQASPILAIIEQSRLEYRFDIGAVQNAIEYIWDFGDNSALEYGIGPKIHRYVDTGTYVATLTIIGECDTITRSNSIYIPEENTSINSITNQSIKLYPNPANDFIQIENNSTLTIQEISIFNTIGQRIGSLPNDQSRLDISKYPTGNYYLIIKANNQYFKHQFIKQ